MNLRLIRPWSRFLSASNPAHPVQELLPEQSCLVALSEDAEQSPAGTAFSSSVDKVMPWNR